jgi:hypothetical protein
MAHLFMYHHLHVLIHRAKFSQYTMVDWHTPNQAVQQSNRVISRFIVNMQNIQNIYNMTWSPVTFVLLQSRNISTLVCFHPGVGLLYWLRRGEVPCREPDLSILCWEALSEIPGCQMNTVSGLLAICSILYPFIGYKRPWRTFIWSLCTLWPIRNCSCQHTYY